MYLTLYMVNPVTESNTEKYFTDPRESSMSFILGRGYESPIVFSFNSRKSRNILHFIFRAPVDLVESTIREYSDHFLTSHYYGKERKKTFKSLQL